MIPIQAITIVSSGGTPMQLCDAKGSPYPTTGFGALVFNTGPTLIDAILLNPLITFDVIKLPGGDFYNPSLQFTTDNSKTPGLYSTGPGNISLVGTSGDESSRVLLASFDHPGNLHVTNLLNIGGTIPPADSSTLAATTKWINDKGYLTPAGAAGLYLPLAGGTLTGPLTGTLATFSGAVSSGGAAAGLFYANGPAGVSRLLRFDTAASARWTLGANSTAEGGSNAGSDFGINAFSDAAGFLSTPLTITRSTGAVTLTGALTGTSGLFIQTVAGVSAPVRSANMSTAVNATGYVSTELGGVSNGYCYWGVVNGSPNPYAIIATGAGITGGLVVQPPTTFQAALTGTTATFLLNNPAVTTLLTLSNPSTTAGASANIQQNVGGRFINRNLDYTGQSLREVGSGITSRYSDFDAHYFRPTAGTTNNAVLDASGLTLSVPLTGTTATFSGTVVGSEFQTTKIATPRFLWNATGNPADQHFWSTYINPIGDLISGPVIDAGTMPTFWGFQRSGATNLPGALTGTTATFSGQVTATTNVIIKGVGGTNSGIVQHDDTHMYVRPLNTGGFLFLGGQNANTAFVTSGGIFPNTTNTASLGNVANVWADVRAANATISGGILNVSGNGATGGHMTFSDTNTGGTVWQVGPGAGSGSSGEWAIYNQGTSLLVFRVDTTGLVTAPVVRTVPVAVASLPAVATVGAGARAMVTNSSVVAIGNFGAIVAAGGANAVPVFCDGANWRIG
jgi:hypothetical protein